MKKLLRAGWLVMAAALMAGLAACTSDESGSEVVEPQAVTPNAVSTIHVTVGAGIGGDSEAQTRSEVEMEYNGETDKYDRRLKFTEGDRLFVRAWVNNNNYYYVSGMLSISNNTITDDGTQASFSGDLTVYNDESGTPVPSAYTFTEDDPLDECGNFQVVLIAKDMSDDCYTLKNYWFFEFDYSKSIAVDDPEDDSDDCVSTLMKKALKVMGTSYKTQYYGVEGPKMFRDFGGDPILNCEIIGLTSGTAYTVTVLGDRNESNYNSNTGSDYNVTFASTVTATSDGIARFAISLEFTEVGGDNYWTLKLVGSGETHYVKLGQKRMETNKVYNVRRLWNGTPFRKLVDLSKVEDDYEAQNGDVLTGEMIGWHVKIPGGATVTLLNATIESYGPGIECFTYGDDVDVTINLLGTNTVNGDDGEPGIYVPAGDPNNFTLTIKGSGSLRAEGSTYDDGNHKIGGAGIGGPRDGGNVIIESGTVTAKGGYGAPGIGCAYVDDDESSFGTITIKNTVTSVTAKKGTDAPYCIGPSKDGACGKIMFGDFEVYDHTGWKDAFENNFTPSSEVSVGGMNFNVNEAGDTWTLTPAP